jgi:hypothetical protein
MLGSHRRPMNQPNSIATLALAYLDRRLPTERAELLKQRLKRDGQARREFARLLLEHVQLKELGEAASLARLRPRVSLLCGQGPNRQRRLEMATKAAKRLGISSNPGAGNAPRTRLRGTRAN